MKQDTEKQLRSKNFAKPSENGVVGEIKLRLYISYKQGYEDHTKNEKSQADKGQKPTQTSIGLFDRPLFDLLNRKLTWR